MKLTDYRNYHCLGSGYMEGILDAQDSSKVIILIRDVFVQPEEARHKGDKREPVYVKPGHKLSLERQNLSDAYKELQLGDKLNLRLAFRKEGDKYYVEILNVDLVKKDNTVPLLTRKQYAVTDDLAHQAVRTICHKFIELTVPDEVPAEPDEAPAEPDGHSIH